MAYKFSQEQKQELYALFNTKRVSLSTYKSSVRSESFTRRPSESYLIVNIWSVTFDRHRLLCWKCPCLHIDHLVINSLNWKLLQGDSVLSPDVIIQGITFAIITVLSYSHLRHARELYILTNSFSKPWSQHDKGCSFCSTPSLCELFMFRFFVSLWPVHILPLLLFVSCL